jgi:hypothetical protein
MLNVINSEICVIQQMLSKFVVRNPRGQGKYLVQFEKLIILKGTCETIWTRCISPTTVASTRLEFQKLTRTLPVSAMKH